MIEILVNTIYFLALTLCLKIIIADKKERLKDAIYFLPIAILGSVVISLTTTFAIGNVTVWTLLILFLQKKKNYTIHKALSLTAMAYLLVITSANGTSYLIYLLFPAYQNLILTTLPLHVIYLVFKFLIVSPCISYLFVKITQKTRHKVSLNSGYQITLANLLILLSFSFQNTMLINIQAPYPSDFYIWIALSTVAFFLLVIFSFLLYTRSIENKHQIEQRKAEQDALLRYTAEIEKQSTDMRKFKHDYQNILVSFGTFIEERDLNGLTTYFEEKVEIVSKKILEQNFTLSHLERVKVKEVKSILINKVITAQGLGVPLQLTVETDIVELPTNTVSLVRMLGIVLDNAIEEVMAIKDTTPTALMEIHLFEDVEGTTMVVSNTCRPNMPPLHRLKTTGFSTKTEGQGLGLVNLSELAMNEPNTSLQTLITQGTFVQKIAIGR